MGAVNCGDKNQSSMANIQFQNSLFWWGSA
jgi:hypothetical protein